MRKKHLLAVLFISWMVFVTFSSLYSFEGDDLPSINIPHADKVVHFTFYFVAMILGSLFLLELKSKRTVVLKKIKFLVVLLIMFGIIIEVIQGTLTVARSGDVLDAVANSTGVTLGYVAILSIFYRQRGLK